MNIDKGQVLEHLRTTPLDELGDEFETLVARVYQHRKANKGYTPKPIFGACVGLGGCSVCVEVAYVVKDAEGNIVGLALKKRKTDNTDPWNDLFHGTGSVIRPNEFETAALQRTLKEASDAAWDLDKLQRLGVTRHQEPERWSTCRSTVYAQIVTEDEVASFKGVWKIFANSRDANIINHHQQIFDQVMSWMSGASPIGSEVDVSEFPVVAPIPE